MDKQYRPAHRFIDHEYLQKRTSRTVRAGYQVPKWISFCSWALSHGLHVFIHESRTTVSKYVYVSQERNGPQFKVRFSNHKPSFAKESAEDCDFFVGVTNTGVRTTEMAVNAVLAWLFAGSTEENYTDPRHGGQ